MKKLMLMICVVSCAAQADIYKCRDSLGRVAFSDRPCPAQSDEQIIAKDTFPESPTNAESGSSTGGSHCSVAVDNAQDWITSMREVGQKNVASGHMQQSELQNGLDELRRVSNLISVSDCEAAQGTKRQFYECVSKITNHISLCMRRHNPF